METWKVTKFCETSSLTDMIKKRDQLKSEIDKGQLHGTNAMQILNLLNEAIALKSLFDED